MGRYQAGWHNGRTCNLERRKFFWILAILTEVFFIFLVCKQVKKKYFEIGQILMHHTVSFDSLTYTV